MEKYKNTKSPLYNCSNKKKLAYLLSDKNKGVFLSQIELRNVRKIFDSADEVFYESKITKHRYSKKPENFSNKKYRMFSNPNEKYKIVLRRINNYLKKIETPSYLFSVVERDYIRNARCHWGMSNYILLDINSFFPSCDYKMIRNWFIKGSGLGMSVDIASILMYLVTIPSKSKHREVPQGYPTSTLICYFAYKEMFDEINEYTKSRNIRFSTYVDDLTLSYDDVTKIDITEVVSEIKTILNKYGHSVNVEKVKVFNCKEENFDPKNQPIITGIYLKRYKIRASYKMHSKMINIYNKLVNLNIIDSTSYLESWKLYLSLDGLYRTIKSIEPSKTEEKRLYIGNYLEASRKLFPFETNVKAIKKLKYEENIYTAYKMGTLREFIKAHKSELFNI